MKKIFALLLALFLFIATFTGCDEDTPENKDPNNEGNQPPVQDNANPASDFEYEENEDGGITISKYIGTDTDVIIPAQIDDKNVTIIGEQSFEENSIITTVKIPDTVIAIKGGAFHACPLLTSVILSQKLEEIQNAAFMNCVALSDIVLPVTLQSIGDMAFVNCKSLKNIHIPQKICELKRLTFMSSGLTTVTFEKGSLLQIISEDVFAHTDIIEIIIPSQVKYLDKLAFNSCYELVRVKFEGDAPEGFEAIQNPPYSIYYHEGSKGFTSPTWNGYPTELW